MASNLWGTSYITEYQESLEFVSRGKIRLLNIQIKDLLKCRCPKIMLLCLMLWFYLLHFNRRKIKQQSKLTVQKCHQLFMVEIFKISVLKCQTQSVRTYSAEKLKLQCGNIILVTCTDALHLILQYFANPYISFHSEPKSNIPEILQDSAMNNCI